MSEICLECGRSVAFGSGLYLDRIPDANTVEERKEMGVPYPDGDFRCIECEENYLKPKFPTQKLKTIASTHMPYRI